MTLWSLANAALETLAAVFAWASVFQLTKEKRVQGVFAPSFLLSAVWAFVAIGYYLDHKDYFSVVPCAVRTLGLAAWSALWAHYKLSTPAVNRSRDRVRLISSRRPGQ